MEKYKTEFKLKVVKSFLAGDGGAIRSGILRPPKAAHLS